MPARPTLRQPLVAVNAVLGVALIAGGFQVYRSLTGPDPVPAADASVRSVPVQVGTVTKSATADGTVESASTASASFGTGGTVTAISVKVGQLVKKGQVLAKVDPAGAQRGLDAAEADLDAAQDSLGRAEDAGSDTSTAENEVTQAQLAVTKAQAAVDGTVLRAPMAGTVIAVNGTLGSSSGSSSSGSSSGGSASTGGGASPASTGSASGFIDLADLKKLRVTAAFAEADATRIKEKQTATVTWNALSGTTAPATVSAIDPAATTDGNVVTYGVTLTLGKVPAGTRAGQTVSVAVTTGSVPDAVMVSSAAVTTTGTRHTVTVLTGGRQETRAVEIGLQGDTTTEITSGVEAGERVVLRTVTPAAGSGTGGFPGGGFGGGPGGNRGFPGGGPGGGGGRR